MERGGTSEAKLEEAAYDGWRVVERREHTTLLEKRSFGSLKMHAVVFALTVWWTAGIGNAVYALYRSEQVGHRRLGPEDAEERSVQKGKSVQRTRRKEEITRNA
jgi:hypothetical protein